MSEGGGKGSWIVEWNLMSSEVAAVLMAGGCRTKIDS